MVFGVGCLGFVFVGDVIFLIKERPFFEGFMKRDHHW